MGDKIEYESALLVPKFKRFVSQKDSIQMKMLKVSSIPLILAFCLTGTCSTPGGSNTGSEAAEPEGTYVFQYQVIAEGGLRLRSRPTVDSEVIEVIPRWTFFEAQESGSSSEEVIAGRRGKWIQYKNGWVFTGFLTASSTVFYPRSGATPHSYFKPSTGAEKFPWEDGFRLKSGTDLRHTDSDGETWRKVTYEFGYTIRWFRDSEMEAGVPAGGFCTSDTAENCLHPGLRQYVNGGPIEPMGCDDCFRPIELFPRGEVEGCGQTLGSWKTHHDGSIRIEMRQSNYRCEDIHGRICNYRYPTKMLVKKVNLKHFSIRESHRKMLKESYLHGYDEGFLPVTMDGRLLNANVCQPAPR